MQVNKIHTCTGHRSSIYALAKARAPGVFLSGGGDSWVVSWKWDDPEFGQLLAAVETQIFSLHQHHDSGLIVAGNMNGGLHFIFPDNPEGTRNIQHHQNGVFGLLSVNEFLYSVGGDGIITRWILDPIQSVESFQLSAQPLRCIDYCPQRSELAIGASDNHIYLLDENTLSLKHVLKQAHSNSVFSTRYTPDGKYLLSGGRDAMLRIWDLGTDHRQRAELPAHWFTINDIAFSPDGSLFATASRDKTIKLWDTASCDLLKVIDTQRDGGHINSVNALLWLPEGLVSASDDQSISLWDIKNTA